MLRLGVSLPALMQMLGHNDIRMTMRYVQVTQQDLQREFYRACHNTTLRHLVPKLPLSVTTPPPRPDLVSIRDSIAVATHLLRTFRLSAYVIPRLGGELLRAQSRKTYPLFRQTANPAGPQSHHRTLLSLGLDPFQERASGFSEQTANFGMKACYPMKSTVRTHVQEIPSFEGISNYVLTLSFVTS
jgi:hypothetical protein